MRIGILYILLIVIACCINNLNSQVINEINPANQFSYIDIYGNTPDWIEIYNPLDTCIDLGGYKINDTFVLETAWEMPSYCLPSGGFLLLLASGTNGIIGTEWHTSFQLRASGETVYLWNDNNELVQSLSYPGISGDKSFGTIGEDTAAYRIYSLPTPREENREIKVYRDSVFDVKNEPGVYDLPFTLEIETTEKSYTYTYTLDGTPPDPSDKVWTGELEITEQDVKEPVLALIPNASVYKPPVEVETYVCFRIAAFQNNIYTGQSWSGIYIPSGSRVIGSLPIMSAVVNPDDFYDPQWGIYTEPAYQFRGADYEHPASLSYFSPQIRLLWSGYSGTRINGGASRHLPQKSLRLNAREQYGTKYFDYPFFGDEGKERYRELIVRSLHGPPADPQPFDAGIRDDLALEILKKDTSLFAANRKFIHLILNGEYWGIFSLRESHQENHIYNYIGIPEYDILFNENKMPSVAIENYAEIFDLTDSFHFQYIKSKMDLPGFTRYMIAETFLNNQDWPHNNVNTWSDRKDIRWHWLIYDLDASMNNPYFNSLRKFIDPEHLTGRLKRNNIILFNKLLKNENYYNYFQLTTHELLNTIWAPTHTLNVLNKMKANLAPVIDMHIDRWRVPHSSSTWENDIEQIRRFLLHRPLVYERIVRELPKPEKSITSVINNFSGEFIHIPEVETMDPMQYILYDLQGRIISNGETDAGMIPPLYEPGMYLLELRAFPFRKVFRMNIH